jgi:hypothetical protein
MNSWIRRLRGAAVMGLTWAILWGMLGGVMELLANFIPPLNEVDMWIQGLAIPGFVAGAIFSVVLRVAGRGRKFSELSLPRFAAWGAAGGLLLGGSLFALSVASSGFPEFWFRTAVILGTLTTVSAASAAGTLALARMGEEPALLHGGGKAPGRRP